MLKMFEDFINSFKNLEISPDVEVKKENSPQNLQDVYILDFVRRVNPNLSRLENLLANQKYSYENIYLKKENYDTSKFHYDWWLFPVEMPAGQYWSDTGAYYSLNPERTKALLGNDEFLEIYINSIKMYLNAQVTRWNNYEVRFGKVLLSLAHFIEATDNVPGKENINAILRNQAMLALEIAQNNNLDRDDFPYDAYNIMKNIMCPDESAEKNKKDKRSLIF